jgi:uncharacterized protein YfaS (alpha-2-macroglobulin family)
LDPTDDTTDENGHVSAELAVENSVRPPSMLRAVVYVECFDTGGRAVAANTSFDVHRYEMYLGLKGPASSVIEPSKSVTLGLAAVSPEGKASVALNQTLRIKRRTWYSIFRNYGWSRRGYETSFYDETVETKTMDIKGKTHYVFTPKNPGQYTIVLGSDEGANTSLVLTAEGPGSKPGKEPTAAVGLDQPEVLNLTLDRKRYLPGQTPKVTIRAPFEGALVLSVERESVVWTKRVPVHAGLNVADLTEVSDEWSPNTYVTGVLVRPPREAQRSLPRMSFGVAPLTVDTTRRKIETRFKMPKEVESKNGIPVTLETGVPGARVVLSAVDEGVLRIVGFATPDPFGWFYRKRSLTVSTWCHFTDVLPELNRRLAVGGDADEAMLKGAASKAARHLNPIEAKRVVTYAYFEGNLKADSNGRVCFRFPTKGFHGQVRLGCVRCASGRPGGHGTVGSAFSRTGRFVRSAFVTGEPDRDRDAFDGLALDQGSLEEWRGAVDGRDARAEEARTEVVSW